MKTRAQTKFEFFAPSGARTDQPVTQQAASSPAGKRAGRDRGRLARLYAGERAVRSKRRPGARRGRYRWKEDDSPVMSTARSDNPSCPKSLELEKENFYKMTKFNPPLCPE